MRIDTAKYAAIVDTGTSLVYLPETYYNLINSILFSEVESYDYYGYTEVPCNDKSYKSLNLRIGDHYFEIPKSEYILKNTNFNGWCMTGLINNFEDYMLLGDVFLRNFYAIHDYENDRLGLVPHVGSKLNVRSALQE